jgi:sec-independent protein translocase protein TatC
MNDSHKHEPTTEGADPEPIPFQGRTLPMEDGGPVKSFLDHLEDLRWVVFKIFITIAIGLGLSFYFAPNILVVLEHPLRLSGIEEPARFLKMFGPADSFRLAFKLALYSGLIFSTPILFYIIGSYLLPAMTIKEKKYVAPAFLLGSMFFLGGVAFCYFLVLPPTLRISREFASWLNTTVDFWTVESYISFVTNFMLGMGISFEFPLLVLLLVKLGFVNHAMLSSSRRYAVIGILVISAIITPSSDVFSMLLMSAPLIVMYEGCIWVSWWMGRKEKLLQMGS